MENIRIKKDDTRLKHLALANGPSVFVLTKLQKLFMNAFASALMQPTLQQPTTSHMYNCLHFGKMKQETLFSVNVVCH